MSDTIREQVEFYFSAANLAQDRFVKETLKENDLWFPLETLMRFKKLAALTTDIEVVKKAVEESDDLVLNEDKTKLTWQDREALKAEATKVVDQSHRDKLICHLGGFPKGTTLEEIQTLLKSKKLAFTFIRMQKIIKKTGEECLTGDCAVEFKDPNGVKTMCEIDWNTDGRTGITCMTKEAYTVQKELNRANVEAEKAKKLQLELERQEQQKLSLVRFEPTPEYVDKHLVQVSNVPDGSSRETFKQYMIKLQAKESGQEAPTTGYIDTLKDTPYELEWLCYNRAAPTGCLKFKVQVTATLLKSLNDEVALEFGEGSTVSFEIMKGDEAKAQWAIIESEKEQMKARQTEGGGNGKKRFGKKNFQKWSKKARR